MAPSTVVFGLLAVFVSRALASCAYGTHLHPRAEEGAFEAPKFGYIGPLGPTNWQGLDAANDLCATGSNQSPIDMVASSFTVVPGSELGLKIPDMEEGAEFENLGTNVEVIAEGGTISVGDVEYTLQQFHFHLPSEHLDNGTSMAMEMHMVWQSEDEKIAVIGVYIDLDDGAAAAAAKSKSKTRKSRSHVARAAKALENKSTTVKAATASTLLETILGSVDQIPTPGDVVTTEPLVMSELVETLVAGSFQSYSGSLTTPPCSEGVSWFVSTQSLSIKTATFLKARSVLGFNSRFPQNAPGESNIISVALTSKGH
ncbi:hypothetical protein AK830_g1649 [Neonectria ditissima]|uniref:carbonic anhydrase n=1 Tax=Neonectria ditissima TaxID=78410 RepID=A0A0P7BMG5_9HYPO|nr:hypothetical protein AK830_g1649 [Neonectria ditissima]